MKRFVPLLLLIFFFQSRPVMAQYNPYLEKKAKNKPSALMAKDNKKHLKKQKRRAKKQMRRSKRSISRKKR